MKGWSFFRRTAVILGALSACLSAHAATLTVTSTADDGSAGTLRAVLAGAGANDTIVFSVPLPATITLTGGELFVSSVNIAGPGAASLTVSGNNSSRVFQVTSSSTCAISGLTISSGVAGGGGVGGNIYSDHASLTLTSCVITNGRTTGGSTAAGAGIYNDQGTLVLHNCSVTNNQAAGNGGGIFTNILSSVTINGSTISGNSATAGGGVYNSNGTVSIDRSLISGNTATNGGGIASAGPATLTVNNSTFFSNTVGAASSRGSAIYNFRVTGTANASVANSTIFNNVASGAATPPGLIHSSNAIVNLGNTILQGLAAEQTVAVTTGGTVSSAGFNLSSDTAAGFLTASGDQVNTNPLLDTASGPKDNGGPTSTLALQSGSPAIDRGKRNTIASLTASNDQRGEPRPFEDPTVPNAAGSDASDIGAYEATLRVTALSRSGNDLLLSFTTVLGRSYQAQSRGSLASGTWNALGGTFAGTGGIVQRTLTNALLSPSPQFYRVQDPPPAPRPQRRR